MTYAAAPAGSSYHGYGLALDLAITGNINGNKREARTQEEKWLESDAEDYGFYGYVYSNEMVAGKPKYRETWHWTYGFQQFYNGATGGITIKMMDGGL